MLSAGGGHNGQDSELICKVKAIQRKELEQRQVIESFVAHFSGDQCASSHDLLQNLIEECSHAEIETRGLWNENGKLKEKLVRQEEEHKAKESTYVEELKRQEGVFAKAQHDFTLTSDDLRKQMGVLEGEIGAKNHTLRRLEDECSQLRIDAGQYESKLESMHTEMTSLDSAMASLHGEISVLQRELDEAEQNKKRVGEDLDAVRRVESALSEEVGTLRKDKVDGDKAREELELQLAEAVARVETADAEAGKRVLSLTAERDTMQANLAKKDTKLKQQSATNQELNELVSKMHNDLMKVKQENTKVVAERNTCEEGLRAEVDRLRSALKSAEEATSASSRLHHGVSDQLASAQTKLKNLQRDCDSHVNEVKKLTKRSERLEREKHDLMMEIASKAKATKDTQAALDVLKTKHEETFEDLNDKDNQVIEAKRNLQARDSEIRQLQSDIKERDDKVLAIERQLNEENKLKEVALEAARTQQREHASRIVESNQKNSRLGSELSAAQNTVESLKKQIIEASTLISTYEKEQVDTKNAQASTHSKLQSLEDKFEESVARLEASEAELEDVKHRLESTSQANKKELDDKERHFHIELTNRTQESKKQVDELHDALATAKRQAETTLERSLTRARNSFQRQLEELQTSHHRELSDARNRVSTVATAMDSLQRELADECSKSSELMRELDMLRELTDSKSSGAEENLARIEKDRAKERSNFESFISNLKNQVKSGNKTAGLLQQQLEAAAQQLHTEKEERKKIEDKLRDAEETLSRQVSSLEELEGEVFALKRQMSENDKKLNYQVQQKTDEIQRVSRRNEVLSEAVTRLTQMNSSDRPQHNTAANDKYIFDETEKAGDYTNPNHFEPTSSTRNIDSGTWGASSGMGFSSNLLRPQSSNDNGSGSFQVNDSREIPYCDNVQPQNSTTHSNHDDTRPRDNYTGFTRSQRASNHISAKNFPPRNEQTGPPSSPDVNSSLLRVQQALDSRRKSHASPPSGEGPSVERGHVDVSANRRGVSRTPERPTRKVNGTNVPKLNFNAEYESEIVEARTPPSGSKDEGLFAVRIRDEVEQGKDRLLPFSPKSASKQSRDNASNSRKSQHMSPRCKTEREVHHVRQSKPDRRALSAPADRVLSR